MSAIRYAAPGRINLIGEHTDYNLGFALPIALPERTVVTYVPDDGTDVAVRSDREDGDVRIPLDTAPGDVAGWAGYVAGVMWALRGAGHRIQGGTMSITSDVEMGSGVASSAALECAVLGALDDRRRPARRSDRDGTHRAAGRERLCRRAHRDDGPTGLAVRRAAQGVDDRLSGAHSAAGGVRPGRLRYRLAADQFACAAPTCGRRVCVPSGVV